MSDGVGGEDIPQYRWSLDDWRFRRLLTSDVGFAAPCSAVVRVLSSWMMFARGIMMVLEWMTMLAH